MQTIIIPRLEKQGLHINEYRKIHYWLKSRFGIANKCESSKCKKISIKYQWAVRLGVDYDYKRENFIQLCRSCHSLLDMTLEHKIKVSEALKGRPKSIETRLKMKRTECKKGHLLTKENAYVYPNSERECRICRRNRKLRFYAKLAQKEESK